MRCRSIYFAIGLFCWNAGAFFIPQAYIEIRNRSVSLSSRCKIGLPNERVGTTILSIPTAWAYLLSVFRTLWVFILSPRNHTKCMLNNSHKLATINHNYILKFNSIFAFSFSFFFFLILWQGAILYSYVSLTLFLT